MIFFKIYYLYVDKFLLLINRILVLPILGLSQNSQLKILSFFELVLKYGIVSIFCGIIELSVFLIMLDYFNQTLFISHLTGFILATLFGYYSHSIYTFDLGKLRLIVLFKFSLQILTIFFLGYYILDFFINIGLSSLLSKLLQLGLVFLVNVSISKFFTFTK